MKTAVAAPADNGRERFLWALQALLDKRLRAEQAEWQTHMFHRMNWIRSFRPFHAPDHPDSPHYAEFRRLYPRPNDPPSHAGGREP